MQKRRRIPTLEGLETRNLMSVATPAAHNPLSNLVHVAIETTKVPTTMTETINVTRSVTEIVPVLVNGQYVYVAQNKLVTESTTTTVAATETIKTLVITSPLLKVKGGSVSFVISDKVMPAPYGASMIAPAPVYQG